MPTYKALFVGLGKMGFHMAGFLSKQKNINLYICNRTKIIESKWKKKFSGVKYNLSNDIKFDFVISCLKDDNAVNSFYKKFIKTNNYHQNTIIIEHSTISLKQIGLLTKLLSKPKLKFVDAPVTGGEEGAKKGSLSVMVGGNKLNFNKSKKVILAYSNNCTQIDQKKIFNALKNGAASSWQFTNRYPTIIKNKFDFGFSTELMTKDLKYVLQHARKLDLNLKLTKSVYEKYKKLQNTVYKNYDTSSLVKSFTD